MKRYVLALVIGLMAVAMFGGLASAHNVGPCNDANGDGSPSGQEYSKHHITALAKVGGLGNDGHKPGSHKGFSACQGVH